MRRLISLLFIALVVSSADPLAVHGQCCSPGNPIGGRSTLGALPQGEGKITMSYSHSRSNAYYRGSRVVEPFFVKGGYFHHVGLAGAYAVSRRLTVESEITYFASKVQEYVDGSTPDSRRGFGVGDWSAMAHLRLIDDRRHHWTLSSGFGLKYPLGTYRQVRDGGLLPLDIQPTTGAVDFRHSVFLLKGFPMRRWRLFAVNYVEVKTANPDGYRYGHLVSTALFGSASLGLRWDAAVQLRGEFRARDRRESGPIPVTGSSKLFISPQLAYAFSQSLVLTTNVDIPVYQYYRGGQLASTFGLNMSVIRRFGVGKLPSDDPPPLFR